MRNPAQAVARLRKQLLTGIRDITTEEERVLLLEYSDQLTLRRETYGHHRHDRDGLLRCRYLIEKQWAR